MSLPTLSVVLANYNHGRYLPVSLAALAGQSVPAKEIIVIDDASSDDSVSVIEGFAARLPSIRLLRNERNLGFVRSVNRGVAEASGDCLFFPAADDRVLPGLFEKSLSLLAAHPSAGLCSTLISLIGLEGEDLGPYHTPVVLEEPGYLSPERASEEFDRCGNWVLSYTAIYRREAYREFGGHDLSMGPACDALLAFGIPRRHGACFIPERLACWRRIETSEGLRRAADWRASLAIIEAMERKLVDPSLGGLFPPSWVRAWKRHSLLVALYELDRAGSAAAADLAALAARLPEAGLADRTYAAALRACPGAAHWATKLYLLAQQKPADLRRIAGGKLRALLPR